MDVTLLLLVAVALIVVVSITSSRLGVAAPLLLTVVGIGYSFIPGLPVVAVPPEVVLDVALPVLVYATAIQTPLTNFRRELSVIVVLSVGLVVISAFAVALLVTALVPAVSFGAALALGAVVSPTDAVAATTIAKRLGLPAPVVTVLEGESLLNDASALTLLRAAIVAIGGSFSGGQAVLQFGYSVVVALGIGAAVGVLGILLRTRLRDSVLDAVVSLALPFVAFLPAQALHASGIIATVTTGLIVGTAGLRHVSARARITERLQWRTVQFLLEGGVFLVMGAQLAPILERVSDGDAASPTVLACLGVALAVVVALLVIRGAVVFATLAGTRAEARAAPRRIEELQGRLRLAGDDADPVDDRAGARAARRRRRLQVRIADLGRFERTAVRWRNGVVATAAGMRGVVTLAGAQSIPEDVPLRDPIVLVALVVAVVTLLGQGGALPSIIRLSRVTGTDHEADDRQAAFLVGDLADAATEVLENPGKDHGGRDFADPVVHRVQAEVERNRTDALKAADRGPALDQVASSQYVELRARVAQALQEALSEAGARGEYSTDVIERVQRSVDHDSSAPAGPAQSD